MKPALMLLMAGAAFLWAQNVKLPQYTRETLPNGAVVLLMPRAGVPLVHFRILVKGGVEAESPQTAGLAGLTAQLLRKGSSKRTSDQFAEQLDFLGGTLVSQQQGSFTSITAEFLKKDFDAGLDLLADATLRPTFPADEVRKEIARRVDGIKSAKDNPQQAISQYFQPAFFGRQHPYGNPPDESTLARIQRADLVDYHAKLYRGPNLIVAVTGDFDPAAAKAKLAQTFGAAQSGDAYRWKPSPTLVRRSQLVLIDKPDATQTYFLIAQPGIDRANPHRVPIELVNTLFGGRFTSMLNEELRVSTGLTYGASSMVRESRLQGPIIISTYTKTETTTRAIDLALEILKRLNEKGITAEQLASVKAYEKGTYPTQSLETIDQLANTIADLEFYGLRRDDVDGRFAQIDAVTLAEANAVAKKYFRSNDLTFVVLGASEKIREQLKKYDPKPVELSAKDPGWGER